MCGINLANLLGNCSSGSSESLQANIPDFSGSTVKSFFTNRVYCVEIELPAKKHSLDISHKESLHALGLTSFWTALCSYAGNNKCINVSVFAEFCLDKHPYFRDFFWHCVTNKFSTHLVESSASDDFRARLIAKLAGCDTEEIMYCVAKKHEICEDEFYRHMLCVLSNADNRDRFVVNVSVMQALYKVAGMPDELKAVLLPDAKYTVDGLLCDVHAIKALFTFLSKCFGDVYKVTEYINSLMGTGIIDLLESASGQRKEFDTSKSSIVEFTNDVITGLEKEKIGYLLSMLDYSMCTNCVLMDIFKRYATRTITSDL
jgi:hypothetical protein